MATFKITGRIELEGPQNATQLAADLTNKFQIRGKVTLDLDARALSSVNALNRGLNELNATLQAVNNTSGTVGGRIATSLTQIGSASQQITNASNAANVASISFTNMKQQVAAASNEMYLFGEQTGLATRRFLAFSLGAGTIISALLGIKRGFQEAVEFQHELVRFIQISGDVGSSVNRIAVEVGRLGQAFGANSADTVKAAVTIRQAGFSAEQTAIALETLAKAAASPNFDTFARNTEGAIAVMAQFRLGANDLGRAFGSINAVAGEFAVSAKDIQDAVIRAGGVFSTLGGNLNQFIALFTSVRHTTQESADSIATGLRTIFARLERRDTIDLLQELGVNLRYTREQAIALGNVNLTNQFIGAFEAVRKIQQALRDIPATDPRYEKVLESIGGTRQLGRALPLIQQSGIQDQALRVASGGVLSLDASSEKASLSLINRTNKVIENFKELFRVIVNSPSFQVMADTFLRVADSIGTVLKVAAPLIPVLTALATIKIAKSSSDFIPGFASTFFNPRGTATGGQYTYVPRNYAQGGFASSGLANVMSGEAIIPQGVFTPPSDRISYVPGDTSVNRDNIVAHLPNSFVLRKGVAQKPEIKKMLGFAGGGLTPFDSYLNDTEMFRQIINFRHSTPKKQDFAELLLRGVEDSEAYKYIPKGSKFIGSGAAALAFQSPSSEVYRIQPFIEQRPFDSETLEKLGFPNIHKDFGPSTFSYRRPKIEPVLQNLGSVLTDNDRSKSFIEKLPFTPSLFDVNKNDYIPTKLYDDLDLRLRASGYKATDMHSGNVGFNQGVLKLIDPGNLFEIDKKEKYKFAAQYKKQLKLNALNSEAPTDINSFLKLSNLALGGQSYPNAMVMSGEAVIPRSEFHNFGGLAGLQQLNMGFNVPKLGFGDLFKSVFGSKQSGVESAPISALNTFAFKSQSSDILQKSYASNLQKAVKSLSGLGFSEDSLFAKDLSSHPELKAAGVRDKHGFELGLDKTDSYLNQAMFFATKSGWKEAVDTVGAKRLELERLRSLVSDYHDIPTKDPVVLPEDFGKKGRGKKILGYTGNLLNQGLGSAEIRSQLMKEFALAESTSGKYLSRARQQRILGLMESGFTGEEDFSFTLEDFARYNDLPKKHSGGYLNGSGEMPIMAQGGEFVFQKSAVDSIGIGNLSNLNKFAHGGINWDKIMDAIESEAYGSLQEGITGGGPARPESPLSQNQGALFNTYNILSKRHKLSGRSRRRISSPLDTRETGIIEGSGLSAGIPALTGDVPPYPQNVPQTVYTVPNLGVYNTTGYSSPIGPPNLNTYRHPIGPPSPQSLQTYQFPIGPGNLSSVKFTPDRYSEFLKDLPQLEKFIKQQIDATNRGARSADKAALYQQKIADLQLEALGSVAKQKELQYINAQISGFKGYKGNEEILYDLHKQKAKIEQQLITANRNLERTKDAAGNIVDLGGFDVGQREVGKNKPGIFSNFLGGLDTNRLQLGLVGASIAVSYGADLFSKYAGTADEVAQREEAGSAGRGSFIGSRIVQGALTYGINTGGIGLGFGPKAGIVAGIGGAVIGGVKEGVEASKDLDLAKFQLSITRLTTEFNNLTAVAIRLNGRLTEQNIAYLSNNVNNTARQAEGAYNIRSGREPGSPYNPLNLLLGAYNNITNSEGYDRNTAIQRSNALYPLFYERGTQEERRTLLERTESTADRRTRLTAINRENPNLAAADLQLIQSTIDNLVNENSRISNNQINRILIERFGRRGGSLERVANLNNFSSPRGLLDSDYQRDLIEGRRREAVLSGRQNPVAELEFGFTRFASSLSHINAGLEDFNVKIRNAGNLILGGNQLFGLASEPRTLGRPLDTPTYRREVEELSSGLGTRASGSLRSVGLITGRIGSIAPELLRNYLRGGGGLDAGFEGNEQTSGNFVGTLSNRLDARPGSLESTIAQQTGRFLINLASRDRVAFRDRPGEAERATQDFLKQYNDQLIEIARQRTSIANQIVAVEQQILNLSLKQVEYIGRTADISGEFAGIRGRQLESRRSGRPELSIFGANEQQFNAGFYARINALGAGQFNANTGIDSLSQRGRNLQGEINRRQTGNLLEPGALQELTNLQTQFVRVRQALELYTQSTQRATYYTEQLSLLNRDRTSRIEGQRRFIMGSDEDRAQLQFGAALYRNFAASPDAASRAANFNSLGIGGQQVLINYADVFRDVRSGPGRTIGGDINEVLGGGLSGEIVSDFENRQTQLLAGIERIYAQAERSASALSDITRAQEDDTRSRFVVENTSAISRLNDAIQILNDSITRQSLSNISLPISSQAAGGLGATGFFGTTPLRPPVTPPRNPFAFLPRRDELDDVNLQSYLSSININSSNISTTPSTTDTAHIPIEILQAYYNGYNSGGIVYASNGMFQPRGTDTVPAMLTPGEMVVNQSSTAANRELLEQINREKGRRFSLVDIDVNSRMPSSIWNPLDQSNMPDLRKNLAPHSMRDGRIYASGGGIAYLEEGGEPVIPRPFPFTESDVTHWVDLLPNVSEREIRRLLIMGNNGGFERLNAYQMENFNREREQRPFVGPVQENNVPFQLTDLPGANVGPAAQGPPREINNPNEFDFLNLTPEQRQQRLRDQRVAAQQVQQPAIPQNLEQPPQLQNLNNFQNNLQFNFQPNFNNPFNNVPRPRFQFGSAGTFGGNVNRFGSFGSFNPYMGFRPNFGGFGNFNNFNPYIYNANPPRQNQEGVPENFAQLGGEQRYRWFTAQQRPQVSNVYDPLRFAQMSGAQRARLQYRAAGGMIYLEEGGEIDYNETDASIMRDYANTPQATTIPYDRLTREQREQYLRERRAAIRERIENERQQRLREEREARERGPVAPIIPRELAPGRDHFTGALNPRIPFVGAAGPQLREPENLDFMNLTPEQRQQRLRDQAREAREFQNQAQVQRDVQNQVDEMLGQQRVQRQEVNRQDRSFNRLAQSPYNDAYWLNALQNSPLLRNRGGNDINANINNAQQNAYMQNFANQLQRQQVRGSYFERVLLNNTVGGDAARIQRQSAGQLEGRANDARLDRFRRPQYADPRLNFFSYARQRGVRRFEEGGAVVGHGGIDTIPAFLSNGEYVFSKNAVNNIGLQNLEQVHRYANGGIATRRGANPTYSFMGAPEPEATRRGSSTNNIAGPNLDTSELQKALLSFANDNSKLIEALNGFSRDNGELIEAMKSFPKEITMSGSHELNVIINGTQAFETMKPELSEMIQSEIKSSIRSLLQSKFPEQL